MPGPFARVLNSQSRRGQAKWFLRLAAGLLVVGVLIRWQGESVGRALQSTSPATLFWSVGFYLSTQIISAAKWRLLLNSSTTTPTKSSAPQPLSLWESYRFYLIGMFCNLWLPTAIGGDAVRATLASKRCGSLAQAASSVLMERLTGFLALITIGCIGLFLHLRSAVSANSADGTGSIIAIGSSALLALTALVCGLWLLRRAAYSMEVRSASKLAVKWANIHRALDLFLLPSARPALLGAVGLSFVFQISQIGISICLALAVGLDLPWQVFLWLVPALAIASMLPIGIGGLGVREASAVTLLGGTMVAGAAIPAGIVIAWSLLWQATLWLSGLPGALAYLTQKREQII